MAAEQDTFHAKLQPDHHHKMKLHCTGKVSEPTTGWTVSLERATPQGINPKTLLLKLNEVGPTGAAGNIVTTHPVEFDEDPAKVHYTHVTIEAKTGSFTIPVQ